MVGFRVVTALLGLVVTTCSWPFDPEQVGYNLNENQNATTPLEYWGEWSNHDFHPSPDNWRFPFYTLFLDRFVNGDPTNDNANGTAWEHDLGGTQLRHGGDIKGLQDTLDYLAGMGIKGLYIAGSPMINMPWGSDGYSPLDFTVLDHHFGPIEAWRECISEIHKRGMYVILDNTMATMADLVGFEGYLNVTTPFRYEEHNALWKSDRRYADFNIGNNILSHCDYPRFYNDSGHEVFDNGTQLLIGCRDSEFDQYGDIEPITQDPLWERQLSKYAAVQDRLREWKPSVLEKISHFSCMQIAMLDIDGFRLDKGIQVTVDAQADFASSMRECAAYYGKKNFFVTAEMSGGSAFNSIYVGRGKESTMKEVNTTEVVRTASNGSDASKFIRDFGKSAVDAACFEYPTFRGLLRFLGLDGQLGGTYDNPINFPESWRYFILTQDLVNVNTGKFDPRHMYGTQNQDQFRWPSVVNGTARQNLGTFIVTLLMPGIPIIEWGEEQAFYVLDSTASNYLYGRQAFSSSTAWQDHGCYKLGSSMYANWPGDSALVGCHDDWNSLDHRDPSHPIRNIMKTMFELRQRFPVLNDGFHLEQLSNLTHEIYLPGSHGTPTEKGIWSTVRCGWQDFQDFTGHGQGNQPVWLVYQNEGYAKIYHFDCSDNETALVAPFHEGVIVKNLLYPYDEHTLVKSYQRLWVQNSTTYNGCLASLSMPGYGFKAFVPIDKWLRPSPVITKFVPGHDARILTSVGPGEKETVPIEIHFSDEMKCVDVLKSITFDSKTSDGSVPWIDESSIICHVMTSDEVPEFVAQVATSWTFSTKLMNVSNGVHRLTVTNATTESGLASTNAVDHFLLRIGQRDNPMVFPRTGNYSNTLLHREDNGALYISHKASGADNFRYSTNFGSSWSDWQAYTAWNTTILPPTWSGTSSKKWSGKHVSVQYWGRLVGSSDQIQQGDLVDPEDNNWPVPRRYPHFFILGTFNEYGYDTSLPSAMKQDRSGIWNYDLVAEWPSKFIATVWGVDGHGRPDLTRAFGDVDGDNVLDLLPPVTLQDNTVNVPTHPLLPHLAYRVIINDADLRYSLVGIGSRWVQIVIFILLALIPVVTGIMGIIVYRWGFYGVKFNQVGVDVKNHILPPALRRKFHLRNVPVEEVSGSHGGVFSNGITNGSSVAIEMSGGSRRKILIATMEYFIEDWNIKVNIGGLGVMAQLMAKHLHDKDLIWVVPCLGGIDYPIDQTADPMHVKILDYEYTVEVQYHVLRNITFILLDAPIFRGQRKGRPYPERMDDFDSAIYYSTWNSCIAEAIKRFPQIDLYHINDYHGAIAPLHLLPRVIPCCLSLHNAEFQGLWPIRNSKEMDETCRIYNLDVETVRKYVQFGEVFNLLHGAASYLRIHQKGFGAVGVSAKYGKRSFQRYPIFWGLRKIGSLPNPDPADTGDLNLEDPLDTIHQRLETEKPDQKCQAQQWASLHRDPHAELFCFVGRMSAQKGIDLIADVFPSVLKKHPTSQLIAIGPVIDLYGKFAALKLQRLMRAYPGRVCVIPQFTSVPPYVFGGVDWALIPSRDEPFGLVAVEFGRRGVLCIGAKVGGLGSMPGWWFTIESTTTKHLLDQFAKAMETALASKAEVRASMRAQATTQRFPVAQWQSKLVDLQEKAINISSEQVAKALHRQKRNRSATESPMSDMSPSPPPLPSSPLVNRLYTAASLVATGPPSPIGFEQDPATENPPLSLGTKLGPGHAPESCGDRDRRRLKSPSPRASSIGPLSEIQTSPSPLPLPTPPRSHSTHRRMSSMETIDMIPNSDQDSVYSLPYPGGTRVSHWNGYDEDTRSLVMEDYYLVPELASLRQTSGPWTRDGRPQAPSFVLNAHAMPDPFISYPESPGVPPPASGGDAQHLGFQTEPDQGFQLHDNDSTLSLDAVANGKKDYQLQNVQPIFTDPTGQYFDKFERLLDETDLTERHHEAPHIEAYLVKSEKEWYQRYHDVKMGRSDSGASRASPIFPPTPTSTTPTGSFVQDRSSDEGNDSDGDRGQFPLQENYVPPKALERFLLIKFGDWPIYSFLLAFGQIIAANSYQITLLTGEVGQPAERLYIIASIYCAMSVFWWIGFRMFKSLYVLTVPYAVYGLAFFILSLSPFVGDIHTRGWVQDVATGFYAAASSSGSFFFALNFGSEGSVPVATWAFRASVIQGTQQAYIVMLWFWGARLTKAVAPTVASTGVVSYGATNTIIYTSIVIPLAILLWAIGMTLFLGLPSYYRQAPGHVPSFYKSITSRNIILWFFVAVLVQNFFLSAPYGRNWKYLWSSQHAPQWAIGLLVALFFGLIWAALLYLFSRLSRSHSWILPIFAVGLGAPRWCQMLWGTSGMGLYFPLPLANSLVAGALAGRSLWLWLGVLDALQGVGFGMILLQTMTRFHITFTLVFAQALGGLATIVARAVAPDKDGPGPVFPNLTISMAGFGNAWFWVAVVCQVGLCVGFFKFFRKEQLQKP